MARGMAGLRSANPDLAGATRANHLLDLQRMALLSLRPAPEHLDLYFEATFDRFNADLPCRANLALSR